MTASNSARPFSGSQVQWSHQHWRTSFRGMLSSSTAAGMRSPPPQEVFLRFIWNLPDRLDPPRLDRSEEWASLRLSLKVRVE